MPAKRRTLSLTRTVGDVAPDEYNWQEQFGSLDPADGFVPLDVGKVRGLAIALHELQTGIREYHEAAQDVYRFVSNYLNEGGRPDFMPKRWAELDAIRQEKYRALLQATGLMS